LNGTDSAFGVFFKPVKKDFTLQLSGLPKAVGQVDLYDGNGALRKSLKVTNGEAHASLFADDDQLTGIWELRLPTQKGKIHISGITHNWPEGSTPAPVWTTSREAYFDLADYHWLLSPRRFARHVKPGGKGKMEFTLVNRAKATMSVEFHAEGALAAAGQ